MLAEVEQDRKKREEAQRKMVAGMNANVAKVDAGSA
jgi:hypothetical protein